MTNENGGILSRLLFLALVGWVAWYLYTHSGRKISLQHFGGQLETAVNKDLTRFGVTDRDVLSQVQKEHRVWILTWVETQRTIQVADPKRIRELSSELRQTAHRLSCTFEQDNSASGVDIQIKKYIWILQRFSFVAKTTAPTPINEKKPPALGPGPQVAFVIDDVAYETASMDRFASLHVPLTFAILPREKHSKELSQKANQLNFPVMLHLPMEPLDLAHNDPGPSGLYLKMTDQELKKQFDKDVASVPNIVGINNHMGSAFTESGPKMALVLQWVKKRNVYFLDSRTSGRSVVCREAKREGVPCMANETFLDNIDSVQDIEKQLDLVMRLAVREGKTIAIGHYRRKFLVEALSHKLPEFQARGIQVVALPTLYHR